MYLKIESKTQIIPGVRASESAGDTKKARARVYALISGEYVGMCRVPIAATPVLAWAPV